MKMRRATTPETEALLEHQRNIIRDIAALFLVNPDMIASDHGNTRLVEEALIARERERQWH